MLREHDVPGGANVGLIDLTARHALSSGFHVVVEGILRADHYGTARRPAAAPDATTAPRPAVATSSPGQRWCARTPSN